MGIQTAADVGARSRTYLVPFDRRLRERGDWMVGLGQSCGRQLDGIFDGAARSWHTSWLAGAMRFRVERINEHHEKLVTQRDAQSNAAAATRIGPAAALDGECAAAAADRNRRRLAPVLQAMAWQVRYLTHTVQDARSTLMSSRHTFAAAPLLRKCRLVQPVLLPRASIALQIDGYG